jgi:acyl-CoA dehydrogenase
MDFSLSEEQESLVAAVAGICDRFGDDYWLKRDQEGGLPQEFVAALARNGWLGICIPEEYGGSGLGIFEAGFMMRTIAESGAEMSGASSIHMNIFGLNPVVVFGTDEQKRRMLPPLARGEERSCFAVTEPDTGLNTTRLKTRARRDGDGYVVDGQKVWISSVQSADKMLLLARTTPLDEVRKPTHGLNLFYTTIDRTRVEVREIEKMGRKAVDSNQVFFDGFRIPAADRIGEEGRGFEYILHGMNPERILVAAEAVGLGRAALGKAVDYAGKREVFDRPIGKNQAIQHPLAECWMNLEAANMMMHSAPWQYDLACPAEPRPIAPSTWQASRFQGLRDGGHDAGRFRLREGVPRRALLAGNPDHPHRADQPAAHPVLHRGTGARFA